MSVEAADDDVVSEEDTEELLQEVERRRSLAGIAAVVVALVGITFSAFQLWIAARSFLFAATLPVVGRIQLAQLQLLQVNAIHVAFALIIAFLLFPPSRGEGFVVRRFGRVVPAIRRRAGADSAATRTAERLRGGVRWAMLDPEMERVTPLDVVLSLLSLLTPYYMLTEFQEIRRMRVLGVGAGRPIQEVYPATEPLVSALAAVGIPLDEVSYALILGTMGLLLVLEATRRTLGLFLAILVSLFIVYARYGYMIPRGSIVGALSIPPTAWDSIVRDLWFNTEAGIFGVPVTVSVRFIYIFILFGAFLEMSGAGKWFIDFAYSLTGTRRGGPAKASVVSSGFMGMLSGSSVANTVTTGAFTIPLMKRSGYSPEFSGAVEASASSGGQILPPVMGAAAFLIVEFTQTPFPVVITAAVLPAIAFFFGMWVMVHFEAVRGDIGGLDASELLDVPTHLRRGWFYLVPLALLLYFLIGLRLSVARAGWYTILAIVALTAFLAAYDEQTRMPLLATVLVVGVAEFLAYLFAGVGLAGALGALVGGGSLAGGLSPSAAASAAVANMATITIAVSVVIMLARPRMDSTLLELDPAVDDDAAATAEQIDRPHLGENQAFRFGAFVIKSMESGARTATTVVVAVAAAGVIPGVISVTGLGPNLTALILSVSGDSLLVLLAMTGVAAIIFGLGMPTTVMYIILVAMLGPAIEAFGVALLAAHLFILYFGLMADVTPPVAVAAFAAAGVAKSEEFATAIIAFLLSLNKIMVPFAFIFSPGILLLRETDQGVRIIGTADVLDPGWFVPEVAIPVLGMFLGVYALGVTIIGYYETAVSGRNRALFAISSVLLMVPEIPLLVVEAAIGFAGVSASLTGFSVTVLLRAVGLAMLVALTLTNRRRAGAARDAESAAAAASDV
jgi:TRAP transporter 4TM/12TM fusion protein